MNGVCPNCNAIQPFPSHYSTDTKRKITDIMYYHCLNCETRWWEKFKPKSERNDIFR